MKEKFQLMIESAIKSLRREEAFAIKAQGEQLWSMARWHLNDQRFEAAANCRALALDCAKEATKMADSIV
jgi:hypothetical protein